MLGSLSQWVAVRFHGALGYRVHLVQFAPHQERLERFLRILSKRRRQAGAQATRQMGKGPTVLKAAQGGNVELLKQVLR